MSQKVQQSKIQTKTKGSPVAQPKIQRSQDPEAPVPQNPLILRLHRLMEAFAKSNDERDFYLDKVEGFLVYVDLDKTEDELREMTAELQRNKQRYVAIPKLTLYEIKKVMEGFVNEKVYDIDTKEKLLDIISSKEARENFLEFVYDHHNEMEKWQQYYQERFRIRIIEWLRNHHFDFVFEEDLDLTKSIVEKVRMSMFDPKANKEVLQARKLMAAKAKTYYLNEALNPRPKRGRPPKQVVKVETEPQFSTDIFVAVPRPIKPFLFTPDYRSTAAVYVFSGKFTSEAELLAYRRQQLQSSASFDAQSLSQKLATLRSISSPYVSNDFGDESFSDMEGLRDVVNQVEVGRAAAKKSLESKKSSVLAEDKKSKSAKKADSVPVKKPAVKAAIVVAKVAAKAAPASKVVKKSVVAAKRPIAKAAPAKVVVKKATPAKKAPAKKVVAAKPVAKVVPAKKTVAKPIALKRGAVQAKVPVKAPLKSTPIKKPVGKVLTKAVVTKPALAKPVAGKTSKEKVEVPKARLRPLPKKDVKKR